jgi:hypothetical protein
MAAIIDAPSAHCAPTLTGKVNRMRAATPASNQITTRNADIRQPQLWKTGDLSSESD